MNIALEKAGACKRSSQIVVEMRSSVVIMVRWPSLALLHFNVVLHSAFHIRCWTPVNYRLLRVSLRLLQRKNFYASLLS